jgi:hypothetical protein
MPSSEFRGVSWSTQKQIWIARRTRGGTCRWLGAFEDEKDAARAVNAYCAAHGWRDLMNVVPRDEDTEYYEFIAPDMQPDYDWYREMRMHDY